MVIVALPKRTSTSDAVRKVIEQYIIEGELKPGEKINQLALSHSLDVSMTIVREALLALETDGLVFNIHNKGIFVADFSSDNLHALFVVRRHLEELVLTLAITNAGEPDLEHLTRLLAEMRAYKEAGDVLGYWAVDLRFHAFVLELAANPYLSQFIASMLKRLDVLRYRILKLPERVEISFAYHSRLVDAFQKRDINLAKKDAAQNIDLVETLLRESLNK